ncbi:MAG TPA: hypothetical protein VFM88_13285 [Vicinamibacteria bacterium]|nr:hypothetical protein [Vicinamibacteria bacterium]
MTVRSLDVAGLLRIDYAAERRKLAEAAFDTPWREVAELVRRAARNGAGRVAIRCRAEAVVVADDGAPPDVALIAAFAACRDDRSDGALRHLALVRLEAEPGLEAASLWPRAVFERVGGETRVRLEEYRLDPPSRAALVDALRFCSPAVTLDGTSVPRGFEGAFAEAVAPEPLRGALALGAASHGDVALLLDGVAVAYVSLPDTPPFAAWIDGASLVEAQGASPARLREAVAGHARSLACSAADLALATVERLPSLDARSRSGLIGALLACARLGLRRSDVLRAPFVPALVAGRREQRSLLDLGQEASANDGSVSALDPTRDPDEALLPAAPVYLLDGETRARIAALLGVRFRPVPTLAAPPSLGARWRRTLAGARAGLREGLLRLRSPRAGRRLGDHELTPAERDLVGALGSGVALSDGNGTARRAGAEWRLPRGGELVRRAALAVAGDPRWRYVASLALFRAGRALPAAWAEEWRRS